MDFSTTNFWAFFFISLFLYFIVNPGWKWCVLLISSLVFILSFSLHLLLYTICYAIFNYLIAIAISKSSEIKFKNLWYQAGIIVNIGMLVFFKYTNFLIDNFFNLLGNTGNYIDKPFLNLLVPLGISFFTFQSIGYLIDVKRGTQSVETNPGKFILFIIYFPKFISGPVERSKTLLPQINKEPIMDKGLFNEGLLQMMWGFIKTIIIADRLALFVNGINNNLHEFSGSILIVNFFVQYLYLYFNFSGYTDIVLGISKLFGINLSINFQRPLFANSVSDFWRRWHISLTSWCNDYIFKRIILKRMSWKKWASVYGVFIAFLVLGIWHGANWTFIIIGLLQGIAINYEFFTRKSRLKYGNKLPVWLNLFFSWIFTLLFVCFFHVIFFSKDIHDSIYYFSHMFTNNNTGFLNRDFGLSRMDLIIILIGFILVFYSEYRDEKRMRSVKEMILKRKILLWVVLIGIISVLLTFGIESGSGSLYKQF
jgi:alginate O-acetyltransferase complex protein AlgI